MLVSLALTLIVLGQQWLGLQKAANSCAKRDINHITIRSPLDWLLRLHVFLRCQTSTIDTETAFATLERLAFQKTAAQNKVLCNKRQVQTVIRQHRRHSYELALIIQTKRWLKVNQTTGPSYCCQFSTQSGRDKGKSERSIIDSFSHRAAPKIEPEIFTRAAKTVRAR